MAASGAGNGLHGLVTGAEVQHKGLPLGSVEEVIDDASGQAEAILVRHGRADYLVRVPARYVHADSASSVEVDDSYELDEIERTAITSGRMPATGEHITDADPTEPAAKAEGTVGSTEGMPRSYDGPATG